MTVIENPMTIMRSSARKGHRAGLSSHFGKHLTTPNSMSYFMVSCRICDKNLDKENASNHMKDHAKRGEIPLIRTKIASSDNAT
jgi:hypothetical protein